MKKIKKHSTAFALIIIFGILLMTACRNNNEALPENADQENVNTKSPDGPEETEQTVLSIDPENMILDGRYVYSFFAEGYGEYTSYFHFYEEVPNLGPVFYVGISNNRVNFTGTYTIEKKEYDYELYMNREEISSPDPVPMTKGKAPYTITFFDWDGNIIDKCGFDGDMLYNDMETIKGSGSGPVIYEHDIDVEESKYAEAYSGEIGVAYLDFIGDEDETATLTLFHNMTYMDLTNMIIEGSWSMEEFDEGGFMYKLTPFNETDTSVNLQVSADKMKATYIPEGGSELGLHNIAQAELEVSFLFQGEQDIEKYGTTALLSLNLYSDNTCELIANVFDNAGVIDKGTYDLEENAYRIIFDNAGEMVSSINEETNETIIKYVGTVEKLGDFESTLFLKTQENKETADILFSFEGQFTTLDIYDNNTYKFAYEEYGLEETGTWIFESYNFVLTQSNGNEIIATIEGDEHILTLEYSAEANSQLKDIFTSPSSIWGQALAQ